MDRAVSACLHPRGMPACDVATFAPPSEASDRGEETLMKPVHRIPLVLLLAALATTIPHTPAAAALRVPQVPVLGGTLQAYLNSVGESINVLTDQDATQTWSHTTSGTTTYTIQLQNSPLGGHDFGLHNGGEANPQLCLLVSAGVNAFSTATFMPGNLLKVNRFDANAGFLSTTTYGGVDPTNFGFYHSSLLGTVYTQDARNVGGLARAITFRGTGQNAGTWWLCFDEQQVPPQDQDFDDCVVLMESVNPTPVSRASWGTLKARFR